MAMADGFAQATKKPVLVNLHSGAGTGNGMCNIMTAFQNKTPLIITAGQGSSRPGTFGVFSKTANSLRMAYSPLAGHNEDDLELQLNGGIDVLGKCDAHCRGRAPTEPAAGKGVIGISLLYRPILNQVGKIRSRLVHQDGVRWPQFAECCECLKSR